MFRVFHSPSFYRTPAGTQRAPGDARDPPYIQPAQEPDRVTFEVAPEGRIVVAEAVMVVAGFGIGVLAGQAEVLSERIDHDLSLTEGLIGCHPGDALIGAGHDLRRVKPVAVDEGERAGVRNEQRDRFVVEIDVVGLGAGAAAGYICRCLSTSTSPGST
jgi:hypothetical protein